jgi:superfamily I DNA/RNA helicase
VVARLAWRVATGADPAGICALTFNRAAAEELQERADAALVELGHEPGIVRVRTFHALGREILADAGFDVSRVLERSAVLEELAAGPLPPAQLRHLDDAFTRLKLDPERGPPLDDAETHAAFEAYQERLRSTGAIDLDDLVALAGPALTADEGLLARWQGRSVVLFVDEAQDLDKTQLDLALLLTGERRDIFAVGDDDQTIYAWRLADVRRVLGLAARLPGLRRVDLQTNHRCAPEVVRRAARLVEHNHERFAKRILASPRTRGEVRLLPDSGDEASRARLLLRTWWTEGTQARHAVLARTNRELIPYAALAAELGIAYHCAEDGLLLDDGRVDAVLGECDPAWPLLPGLAAASRRVALPPELAASLLGWAAPYETAAQLRAALAERREARSRLLREDARLTLATAHGTKGLEWDHVACIGHDEGAFPSGRALREADDPMRVLEEERRLAYVAWTRARLTLTIVYDAGAPSTFVREAFDPHEWGEP